MLTKEEIFNLFGISQQVAACGNDHARIKEIAKQAYRDLMIKWFPRRGMNDPDFERKDKFAQELVAAWRDFNILYQYAGTKGASNQPIIFSGASGFSNGINYNNGISIYTGAEEEPFVPLCGYNGTFTRKEIFDWPDWFIGIDYRNASTREVKKYAGGKHWFDAYLKAIALNGGNRLWLGGDKHEKKRSSMFWFGAWEYLNYWPDQYYTYNCDRRQNLPEADAKMLEFLLLPMFERLVLNTYVFFKTGRQMERSAENIHKTRSSYNDRGLQLPNHLDYALFKNMLNYGQGLGHIVENHFFGKELLAHMHYDYSIKLGIDSFAFDRCTILTNKYYFDTPSEKEIKIVNEKDKTFNWDENFLNLYECYDFKYFKKIK